MKNALIGMMLVSSTMLLGCAAHQIQINPNTANFSEPEIKFEQVVGYHISDTDRKKNVTTPAGGGDKVSYMPYKELETALYTILSNKFSDVYLVKSLDDETFVKENEIKLIFIPEITTDSSSNSMFTWPPSKFSIELTVKAIDSFGVTVWENKVQSEGEAEYPDFRADQSIAARRATEKVFIQLANELNNSDSVFNREEN